MRCNLEIEDMIEVEGNIYCFVHENYLIKPLFVYSIYMIKPLGLSIKSSKKKKAISSIIQFVPIHQIEVRIIIECSDPLLMHEPFLFSLLCIINLLKQSTYEEVVKEYSVS